MLITLAAAATGAAAEAPPAWISWLPIVGMIAIFWFLIIRPQMRQQKAHQAKVAGLKRGDEVLTAGGVVGKVMKVEDVYAELEIAKGVRVRVLKSTIGDVIQPGPGAPAAND
ncbi:preprotein translocase subunit YajC [Qipengyuania sediminis]|uniref:preprotein translocase subunit YajC n=1 Tax=Qipengyuania sediminis TaxID=1532023 RepID=UPI001059CF54|nr:preprotein translocase subunit YajC [Qipengyuania sediminis]